MGSGPWLANLLGPVPLSKPHTWLWWHPISDPGEATGLFS